MNVKNDHKLVRIFKKNMLHWRGCRIFLATKNQTKRYFLCTKHCSTNFLQSLMGQCKRSRRWSWTPFVGNLYQIVQIQPWQVLYFLRNVDNYRLRSSPEDDLSLDDGLNEVFDIFWWWSVDGLNTVIDVHDELVTDGAFIVTTQLPWLCSDGNRFVQCDDLTEQDVMADDQNRLILNKQSLWIIKHQVRVINQKSVFLISQVDSKWKQHQTDIQVNLI